MSIQAYLQQGVDRRRRLMDPVNAVVDRPIELRKRQPVEAVEPVFHVKPQVIHIPIPVPPLERAQACLLPPRRHERWPGMTLKDHEEAMLCSLARGLSNRQIKRVVAAYYGVEVGDLEGVCRTKQIVLIRHVAMYLTKTVTGRSLPEIGRHFGRRDHTTVLHAIRNIERKSKADESLAKAVTELTGVLKPFARD
jgi:hypothetical protein